MPSTEEYMFCRRLTSDNQCLHAGSRPGTVNGIRCLIVADFSEAAPPRLPKGVATHSVRIVRKPSALSDFRALVQLMRLFRQQRFDLVHSVTPKAGLLSMLAAYLARVPNRWHTFTGQVWVTKRGPSKAFLRWLDPATGALATRVLVDSWSQRDFLIEQRVIGAAKSTVLANGSISGVDPARFRPNPTVRAHLRRNSASMGATLFMYLGRLNHDKGVKELATAFQAVSTHDRDDLLLFCGAR